MSRWRFVGRNMMQLRRIRELTEMALHATDGDIGAVEEAYFDDRNWTIRYFVVSTGGWLLGRRVLLAPSAVRRVDDAAAAILTNLTREQIETAPSIDTAKPLSREQEDAYFRHFNWQPYWQPGPMFWQSRVPYPGTAYPAPSEPLLQEPAESTHLRSSGEVTGYGLHAVDGEIGHVEDLVADDADWVIRYAEVDTRNWLPGKKVLVSIARIQRISWAERSVDVGLTRQAIESAPAYDPSQLITPEYEIELFKHYGETKAA